MGCRAADGTLWFPTARGVAVLDPSKLHPNPVAPNVVVEEVVVDGETVDLHRPVALAPGTELPVPPHRAELRLPREGPVPVPARRLGRRVVEAGEPPDGLVHERPRGRHVFRVTACNEDGVWSEAEGLGPLPPAPAPRDLVVPGSRARRSPRVGVGAHRARTWRLEGPPGRAPGPRRRETRSVVEANEQLEQANALLEEAQAKLASLVRSPRAVEDVARWAAETATEIARTIEVDSVDVWVFENGALSSAALRRLPARPDALPAEEERRLPRAAARARPPDAHADHRGERDAPGRPRDLPEA